MVVDSDNDEASGTVEIVVDDIVASIAGSVAAFVGASDGKLFLDEMTSANSPPVVAVANVVVIMTSPSSNFGKAFETVVVGAVEIGRDVLVVDCAADDTCFNVDDFIDGNAFRNATVSIEDDVVVSAEDVVVDDVDVVVVEVVVNGVVDVVVCVVDDVVDDDVDDDVVDINIVLCSSGGKVLSVDVVVDVDSVDAVVVKDAPFKGPRSLLILFIFFLPSLGSQSSPGSPRSPFGPGGPCIPGGPAGHSTWQNARY